MAKLTKEDITYYKYLGSGSFGYVFEATAKNNRNGDQFAVKLSLSPPTVGDKERTREYETMKKRDHPNIVKILDFKSEKFEAHEIEILMVCAAWTTRKFPITIE